MSSEALLLIVTASAVLLAAKTRQRRVRSRRSPVRSIPDAFPDAVANADDGIAMTRNGLRVQSWDRLMKDGRALRMAQLAIEESEGGSADEIVANLFRRLYPETTWPPSSGPMAEQWPTIVAAVGRTLGVPFPGHAHVVG